MSNCLEEVKRLSNYLMDLHISGEVCVFITMSGHVDEFGFSVVASQESYNTVLFAKEFYFYNPKSTKSNWNHDWQKNKDWKKFVDELIEDIEFAIKDRENKVKEHEANRLEAEKKRYEELKAKFEG